MTRVGHHLGIFQSIIVATEENGMRHALPTLYNTVEEAGKAATEMTMSDAAIPLPPA